MEYTVFRSYFPHGIETEAEEMTIKYFPTFEKALAYGQRYAKGPRFSYFEICDENMQSVYEQDAAGNTTDRRED